jgi:hypothetical protein
LKKGKREEEVEEEEEKEEEAASQVASRAWTAAEEAHLSSLLARFPKHGDPKKGSTDRGSATWRNNAFWERMSAVLGGEGGARTAMAVYRKSLEMRIEGERSKIVQH